MRMYTGTDNYIILRYSTIFINTHQNYTLQFQINKNNKQLCLTCSILQPQPESTNKYSIFSVLSENNNYIDIVLWSKRKSCNAMTSLYITPFSGHTCFQYISWCFFRTQKNRRYFVTKTFSNIPIFSVVHVCDNDN